MGHNVILFISDLHKQDSRCTGRPLRNDLTLTEMCPGTSRSLMTMLGGLMTGLSMAAAVEFSFLLGLITLGAATVYDFMKYGSNMVAEIGWGAMLAGTFMSWLSAIIAVKWMVSYLKKHGLSLFGWYRIAAALVMLVMILHGLKV